MARKNHIKKKNDLRQEQYIQKEVNFLIETMLKKTSFGSVKIFSVRSIFNDIMQNIYLCEKCNNIESISNIGDYLITLKNGESFKACFLIEPNYVYFRKAGIKRPKRKNFVNFCKICQINLNVVETILEKVFFEII